MTVARELRLDGAAPPVYGLPLLERAVEQHNPVGIYALFSGGHDSLVSTHLTAQHPRFSGVLHINTGIGIEETRQFVRETCLQQGWSLHEYHAAQGAYERYCLAKGMPGGPVHHSFVYHRLKSEPLQHFLRDHRRRGQVLMLSTGIRTAESRRRMRLHPEPMRKDRLGIWVNPIADFSALDVNRYMEMHGLARNPVSDKLHRSGECLCGALADPSELREIAFWYPQTAQRIRDLERECFNRGLPCDWGSKQSPVVAPEQGRLPLCDTCETRWEMQDRG